MIGLRFIFCCCLFCYFIGNAKGQDASKQITKRNSIYGEFAGISGSVSSINYDRILHENENSFIDLTLGFGYFPFFKDLDPIIGIPVSINYTYGSGVHHFEAGAGLTYNSGINRETLIYEVDGINISYSYKETKYEVALWSSFRIGYKYQKPNGGLFIRLGLTPLLKIKTLSVFKDDRNIFPAFGLGIGYTL